ncbi:MAG TPA: hypothetical protein VIY48_10025, partial [Candidatus Paceibacterota bacterium]
MTRRCKVGLTVLIVTMATALEAQTNMVEQSGTQIPKWVTNAVQWDSVWGSEVTCTDKAPTLSQQLATSADHIFTVEVVRYQDGVVVTLPELHRVVSIKLTSNQQLASLRIETSCEPDLAGHEASLKSLGKSSPIENSRLKRHLDELKKQGPSGPEQTSAPVRSTLKIDPPGRRTMRPEEHWPRDRVEALKSVEAALQGAFAEVCVSGSRAV